MPPALQRHLLLAGAPAKSSAEVALVFVMTDRVMTNLPSNATHVTPTSENVNRQCRSQSVHQRGAEILSKHAITLMTPGGGLARRLSAQ
jgi:hypothetical protein